MFNLIIGFAAGAAAMYYFKPAFDAMFVYVGSFFDTKTDENTPE